MLAKLLVTVCRPLQGYPLYMAVSSTATMAAGTQRDACHILQPQADDSSAALRAEGDNMFCQGLH